MSLLDSDLNCEDLAKLAATMSPMRLSVAILVLASCASVALTGQDRGNCVETSPPPPNFKLPTGEPPRPPSVPSAAQYLGTVALRVVLSDTGYVCSSQVIAKVRDDLDAKALAMVKNTHFAPPQQQGRSVIGATIVGVGYWQKPDGEVLGAPMKLNSSEQ